MKYALISFIFALVGLLLKLLANKLIEPSNFIYSYTIIAGGMISGHLTFGVLGKLRKHLLRDHNIIFDVVTMSSLLFIPLIYSYMAFGSSGWTVHALASLYLGTFIFGVTEYRNDWLSRRGLVGKFAFNEFLIFTYQISTLLYFIGAAYSLSAQLFILIACMLVQVRSSMKMQYVDLDWKLSGDRFFAMINIAIVIYLPLYIANDLEPTEGANFFVAFAFLNAIASTLMLMVNRLAISKMAYSLNFNSIIIAGSVVLYGAFYYVINHWFEGIVPKLSIIPYTAVCVYIVSRICFNGFFMSNRLRDGGDVTFQRVQAFRLVAMLAMFMLIEVAIGERLYLCYGLAVINVTALLSEYRSLRVMRGDNVAKAS